MAVANFVSDKVCIFNLNSESELDKLMGTVMSRTQPKYRRERNPCHRTKYLPQRYLKSCLYFIVRKLTMTSATRLCLTYRSRSQASQKVVWLASHCPLLLQQLQQRPQQLLHLQPTQALGLLQFQCTHCLPLFHSAAGLLCASQAQDVWKDLEGSFEVPSGQGGCLRPSWACLPSSYQAKSQQYCGPNGPTASIFYGI